MSEPVLVESIDAVALLTLNRPRSLNAISSELASTLVEQIRAVDRDPGVHGIVLTGAGVALYTHDVILQHLRIRPGTGGGVDPEVNDVVATYSPPDSGRDGVHHVVIDHVSASWGEDENVSLWGGDHITVSRSIVSEALDEASHEKGGHSAGFLVGWNATWRLRACR